MHVLHQQNALADGCNALYCKQLYKHLKKMTTTFSQRYKCVVKIQYYNVYAVFCQWRGDDGRKLQSGTGGNYENTVVHTFLYHIICLLPQ